MIHSNHMDDSPAISAQAGSPTQRRWLLLIHQIPPKPDYFRVKVRRRLHRIGARAIKNSVYVLPWSDDALEDFQWLAREIVAEGGEAVICDAAFLEGISDREVGALFALPGDAAEPSGAGGKPPRARTWVTRQGVKVDRIASAWLIRRFLDPDARFKFVPARGYRPLPGELRFDMFEAEYTHDGDRCTFETLLRAFGQRDRALRAIGEIVHDLDMKDEKYGRREAAGLAAMIAGIVRAFPDDAARLDRGAALFDDLYASLRGSRRSGG
jgi:hypothetical protein